MSTKSLILLVATSVLALSQTETPAQRAIAHAKAVIAKNPAHAAGQTALAMALARRARETADPKYYAEAETAVQSALAVAPGNIEALKARTWILLGNHRFGDALEQARELNRRVPDDVLIYGLLVDAAVEVGEYAEAEQAAQWMLDLRPGNVPALTRAAYLRELFGDPEGAIELMRQAYDSTRSTETEDRAWMATQLGHLYLSVGKLEEATQALQIAAQTFPDYHYTLAQLGRLHAAKGDHKAAAGFFERRYALAPHPENAFDLGVALHHAGRMAEARVVFADFEKKARAEMLTPDNANRELIRYYIEYARKPAEALRIARRERAIRKDIHTLHSLAWALHASGRHAEARQTIEQSLAPGLRDAQILYHAGAIAAALSDRRAAASYLNRSLAANPMSEVAPAARKLLSRLEHARATPVSRQLRKPA